jgi:hypothetical protein
VLGRRRSGFAGFGVSRDAGYGGLNGVDGGGDILRGRPGPHVGDNHLAQAFELGFSGVAFFQEGGEGFEIAAAINEFGFYGGV